MKAQMWAFWLLGDDGASGSHARTALSIKQVGSVSRNKVAS